MGKIIIKDAEISEEQTDLIMLALNKIDSPYTIAQIKEAIKQNSLFLAGIYNESILVGNCSYYVGKYPDKKKLVICSISGVGYDSWGESLTDFLVIEAKKNNCASIIGTGRKGWVKKMRGFKQKPLVIMEMEV